MTGKRNKFHNRTIISLTQRCNVHLTMILHIFVPIQVHVNEVYTMMIMVNEGTDLKNTCKAIFISLYKF